MKKILLETVFGLHEIQMSLPHGSVEGYVVSSDQPQVENWLHYRHGVFDIAAEKRVKSYSRIAFLNNINVDEDVRGEGLGNALMEFFVREAGENGANTICLIADNSEDQIEGFDLAEWYRGWGFEKITDTASGPFMILEL